MRVIQTEIPDLIVIEPQVFEDARGYFFESYNQKRFEENGINNIFVQDNQSRSAYGVIRGLHYQLAPYAQSKLVRVLHGKILDVAVDIRQGSPTFGKSFAIELSAENKKQFLVPRGFAHGFSVLSPQAVVFYKCDNFYQREAERGINFNDPQIAIDWQIAATDALVSSKDKVLPMLQEAEMNFIFGKENTRHKPPKNPER